MRSHKIVNANAKTQATTTLWPLLVWIVFDALSSAQSKYCLIQRTSRKGFRVFHCDRECGSQSLIVHCLITLKGDP